MGVSADPTKPDYDAARTLRFFTRAKPATMQQMTLQQVTTQQMTLQQVTTQQVTTQQVTTQQVIQIFYR